MNHSVLPLCFAAMYTAAQRTAHARSASLITEREPVRAYCWFSGMLRGETVPGAVLPRTGRQLAETGKPAQYVPFSAFKTNI